MRAHLIISGRNDLRRVGFAVLTRSVDTFFLKTVDAPFENIARVDSGPLGQAVVHGYFLKLAEPLHFLQRTLTVLRFSDYSKFSNGTVEFGNIDEQGRWVSRSADDGAFRILRSETDLPKF